jgi:hypothetical protein
VAISLALLVTATFVLLNLPRGERPGASGVNQSAANTANSTTSGDGGRVATTNASGGETSNGQDAEVASTADDETIRPLSEPVWRSPTAGDPLDLRYLPPGGQLFCALRPADLLAHAEGAKLLALPGPWGPLVSDNLPEWCGLEPAEIQQLVLSLSSAATEGTLAAVARTPAGVTREAWLTRLGQPDPFTHDSTGETLYRRGGWVYFTPEQDVIQTVVIVPDDPIVIDGMLASRHRSHPLRLELETLLESSDGDRHVTVLFAPSFLFTGGRWLFDREAALLKSPLDRFLGDDVQAALLSFHLDENLFAELRVVGAADLPVGRLVQGFAERVDRMPIDVEDYIVGLTPSPYSRRVLLRYPQMVHLLARYTRAGTDDRQAVMRSVLPAVAAHNLALGTHLAMLEAPGVAIAADAGGDTAQVAASAAEKLHQRITLAFDRNTLEHCLELLSDEIGVPIRILGGDLQLEGITKNQSFGLDETDKPASEVLKTILDLANPDGKLVYVIKADAETGQQTVLITTRAAAASRNDPLPAELRPAE